MGAPVDHEGKIKMVILIRGQPLHILSGCCGPGKEKIQMEYEKTHEDIENVTSTIFKPKGTLEIHTRIS